MGSQCYALLTVSLICRRCASSRSDSVVLKTSERRDRTIESSRLSTHMCTAYARKSVFLLCHSAPPKERESLLSHSDTLCRRGVLQHMVYGFTLAATCPWNWFAPKRSEASLLQFPAVELRNTYYLVRTTCQRRQTTAQGLKKSSTVADC